MMIIVVPSFQHRLYRDLSLSLI